MLQRKQPAVKNPAQNLAESSAELKMRSETVLAKLAEKKTQLEQECRAALAKKDPPRAKQCFQQMKVIDSQMAGVREQISHAELAVLKSEVNEFSIQAAKMLQATAISQQETARKVDPGRVEAISAALASSSAQIQHTAATVSTALKGITGRESDAAENAELERMAEGGADIDAEFNVWAMAQSSAPVSEAPGKPAEKAPEEPEYVKILRAEKEREKSRAT